ncbi:MAG: class I SAM-dependent methyltransferase [Patescibacteria group bacterium]
MVLSEKPTIFFPQVIHSFERSSDLREFQENEILANTQTTLKNQIEHPPLDDPLMTNFSIVALELFKNDSTFYDLIKQAIQNRIRNNVSVEPKVITSVIARAISAIMIREEEYDFTDNLKTTKGTEELLTTIIGDFTKEYLEIISREVPQTNVEQRSLPTALVMELLYGDSRQENSPNIIDIGGGYGNLGLCALATGSYKPVADFTPGIVTGRLLRNKPPQYNQMVGLDIAPAKCQDTETWVAACDTFKNLTKEKIVTKLTQLHEWKQLPNVSRVVGDAFQLPFAKGAADITTSSVWMYMLNDEQRTAVLDNMNYVTHPEHGIQILLEHAEGVETDDNGRDRMRMTRKWGKYPVAVHIFGPEITKIYGRERMLRPFIFPNTRCERIMPGVDYEETMTIAKILRQRRTR